VGVSFAGARVRYQSLSEVSVCAFASAACCTGNDGAMKAADRRAALEAGKRKVGCLRVWR